MRLAGEGPAPVRCCRPRSRFAALPCPARATGWPTSSAGSPTPPRVGSNSASSCNLRRPEAAPVAVPLRPGEQILRPIVLSASEADEGPHPGRARWPRAAQGTGVACTRRIQSPRRGTGPGAAAALNRLDSCSTRRPAGRKLAFPHVVGSDGAGVVEQVGEAVRRWRPGDRVMINPDPVLRRMPRVSSRARTRSAPSFGCWASICRAPPPSSSWCRPRTWRRFPRRCPGPRRPRSHWPPSRRGECS